MLNYIYLLIRTNYKEKFHEKLTDLFRNVCHSFNSRNTWIDIIFNKNLLSFLNYKLLNYYLIFLINTVIFIIYQF